MKAIEEVSRIVKSAMEKQANPEIYQAYNNMSPDERQQVYDDIMKRSGGNPTKSSWVYFANLHRHETRKAEEAKARREAAAAKAQAERKAEENMKYWKSVREANKNRRPKRPSSIAHPSNPSNPSGQPTATTATGTASHAIRVDPVDEAFANLARISGNSYVHGGKVVYPSR